MNVPWVSYYLFKQWLFPPHLHPTLEDLFLLLTSRTQLENFCLPWLFALYYLQHPSHFCCTSSSEVLLIKFTLLKRYPFLLFTIMAILPESSTHSLSSLPHFPLVLHPCCQDCTLFSYFQPITWILFCTSQEPPNYTLQLDYSS